MAKMIRHIRADFCVLICRLYRRWELVQVALLRWKLDVLFTIRSYKLTAEDPWKEHKNNLFV